MAFEFANYLGLQKERQKRWLESKWILFKQIQEQEEYKKAQSPSVDGSSANDSAPEADDQDGTEEDENSDKFSERDDVEAELDESETVQEREVDL